MSLKTIHEWIFVCVAVTVFCWMGWCSNSKNDETGHFIHFIGTVITVYLKKHQGLDSFLTN